MKRNRGFGLIQVMVAAGIMGFIGLAMMKMVANQQKSQRSMEAKMEIGNFVQTLRAQFSRASLCRINLRGVSAENPVPLKHLKNSAGKVWFERDTLYGQNRFKLTDIRLGAYQPDLNDPLNGYMDLHLGIEKTGQTYGGKNVSRKIPLFVVLDGSKKIQKCFHLTGTVPSTAPQANPPAHDSAKIQAVQKAILTGRGDKADEVNQIIENNPLLKSLKKSALESHKAQQEMKKLQKLMDEEAN